MQVGSTSTLNGQGSRTSGSLRTSKPALRERTSVPRGGEQSSAPVQIFQQHRKEKHVKMQITVILTVALVMVAVISASWLSKLRHKHIITEASPACSTKIACNLLSRTRFDRLSIRDSSNGQASGRRPGSFLGSEVFCQQFPHFHFELKGAQRGCLREKGSNPHGGSSLKRDAQSLLSPAQVRPRK